MNLLAASTCCVNNAGVFGDGGDISDRALGVYTAVFWSSVVLGLIVTGLLVYAFIKFRRRRDDDDPPQFHGNTRLEIAWTLVPLATFLSLFGLTAVNMPFINNQNAATKYTVTVIGQQFSWTFDYGTTVDGARIRSFGTLYLPRTQYVEPEHRLDGSAVQQSNLRPPRGARSRRSSPRGMWGQPQLLRAVARPADERDPG